MGIADWFLLGIRWLHALAAVAWVGGSIFVLFVLRPSLRDTPHETALNQVADQEFRNLVDVAISALLVTGVILSINRLASGYVTAAYGTVLGAKIALAALMFYLVWFHQRRRASKDLSTSPSTLSRILAGKFSTNNVLLLLGIVVLLLATVLGGLFERGITGE